MTIEWDTFYLLPLKKFWLMKRYGLPILLVVIVAFFIYRMFSDKDNPGKEHNRTPLELASNTGPFNQSYNELLNSYYTLKDALVKSDTAEANASSLSLGEAAGQLKVDDISGDTSGTIKETVRYYMEALKTSANTVLAGEDLEAKRKEFEVITDAVWSLTRIVRYDGQKIYYQYCPMAFDNKGAYWLSDKPEIVNPYFGSKMLNCGEIADSLDYSMK